MAEEGGESHFDQDLIECVYPTLELPNLDDVNMVQRG